MSKTIVASIIGTDDLTGEGVQIEVSQRTSEGDAPLEFELIRDGETAGKFTVYARTLAAFIHDIMEAVEYDARYPRP